MATDGEGTYVCTLSPELVKKAEEELNEKPQWRKRDIEALRQMVKETKGLNIRTDDAFLLRYLRARKFDYDRAYELIMTHYRMKLENPDLFNDLKPSAIRHMLEAGVTSILSHRDKEGRRVILFRPGKWDPERYPINDVFRTNFATMSKIIEEEETQIHGVVMMVDLSGMGWAHAKNISPFYAKRIAALLQDAFPARFKAMHYINEPSFFDAVFAIMKNFMKEKLTKRLHFHGPRVDEMKEFIDEEFLPQEYGGKAPPFSQEEWTKIMLDSEETFEQNAKYGLNDPNAGKNASKKDAMECLVGTYRKLNV